MRSRYTPNGFSSDGRMTDHMVSVSPILLMIRYVGRTRAVAGTMISPSSTENRKRRPGKSSFANAYPAAAAIAVAPLYGSLSARSPQSTPSAGGEQEHVGRDEHHRTQRERDRRRVVVLLIGEREVVGEDVRRVAVGD